MGEGEGGVWRDEGSEGAVNALALVLLDGGACYPFVESKTWVVGIFMLTMAPTK